MIHEITTEILIQFDLKMQKSVVKTLQEVIEVFLINKFESKLLLFTLIVRLIANIF